MVFPQLREKARMSRQRVTLNLPTERLAQAIYPCCGQPVVPERLSLPPIKRRILETVQRQSGISAEQLREIILQSNPAVAPKITRSRTFTSSNLINSWRP